MASSDWGTDDHGEDGGVLRDLSNAIKEQQKPKVRDLPLGLHIDALWCAGIAAVLAGQWTLSPCTTHVRNILELHSRPGITPAMRCMYDRDVRTQWERLSKSDPSFDVNGKVLTIDDQLVSVCKLKCTSRTKGDGKGGNEQRYSYRRGDWHSGSKSSDRWNDSGKRKWDDSRQEQRGKRDDNRQGKRGNAPSGASSGGKRKKR